MCQFISVLVLKGEPPRVLHRPGVDSHSELERIFNVRERPSASATDQPFAKVEFVPDWTKDVSKPEAWTFIVDEPRKPDWWTDDVEVRVRRDLWAIVEGTLTKGEQEERGGDWIVVGGTKLKLKNGRAYAMPQSRVEASGSSRVEAWDSSRVVAWDSSRVEAPSTYCSIIGRAPWDGSGFLPLWCKIEVGKTYGVRDGELEEVEAAKA